MQIVMKKTMLIIIAVLGFATVAGAQPRAIGLRSGWGLDFSYEHTLKGPNFAEFEVGLDGYAFDAFHADAIYNFMIATPDWTPVGTWGIYAGPGVSAYMWPSESVFYGGILGNVGLEYKFKFPLQLSVDVRPRIMFGNGGVWTDGIFYGGVSARYYF